MFMFSLESRQEREGRWQSQGFVCVRAPLHRCGRPITLQSLGERRCGGCGGGGGGEEMLRCLVDSWNWRGSFLNFFSFAARVQKCVTGVSGSGRFPREEMKTGNERKCRTWKVFGLRTEQVSFSALCVLCLYSLCLSLKLGSEASFPPMKQNKSASAGTTTFSLESRFSSIAHRAQQHTDSRVRIIKAFLNLPEVDSVSHWLSVSLSVSSGLNKGPT